MGGWGNEESFSYYTVLYDEGLVVVCALRVRGCDIFGHQLRALRKIFSELP